MTDYIYRYSRAQAVEDGVLVDVSKIAREAGITFPVAVTCAVWEQCIAVPPAVKCQDVSSHSKPASSLQVKVGH